MDQQHPFNPATRHPDIHARSGRSSSCADDGRGAEDLSRLNMVFVTGKKDGVTQRGRMGCGFKEMLSIATYAAIRSRDQELCFTVGSNGVQRVTYRRGFTPHPGFEAVMEIVHDAVAKNLSGCFRAFLLPPDVVLMVNSMPVPLRMVHRTVEARLTTKHFARGPAEEARARNARPPGRCCGGKQPLIHEMGIPVCDAEWSEPFHIDVCQRVPMLMPSTPFDVCHQESLRDLIGRVLPDAEA